jgi:excisionase family DNA binding protein
MLATAHTYLTVEEVASRLSVHTATVYRLIRTRQLPAVQLGGRGHSLRIPEATLTEWLNESVRNGHSGDTAA